MSSWVSKKPSCPNSKLKSAGSDGAVSSGLVAVLCFQTVPGLDFCSIDVCCLSCRSELPGPSEAVFWKKAVILPTTLIREELWGEVLGTRQASAGYECAIQLVSPCLELSSA